MTIKKSGGPKTVEGKLISSRNSLKTGAYSNLAVLPNESQEEFDQLVNQFNLDFYPRDAFEITLVRELAVITWKKLRLEKLEQAYLIKKLNDPITLEEFVSCGNEFTEDRYQTWPSMDGKGDNDLEKFKLDLKQIKPYLKVNMTAAQLSGFKEKSPWLYESIVSAYGHPSNINSGEPTLEDLVNEKRLMSDQAVDHFLPLHFTRLNAIYSSAVWCIENREKVEGALAQIKQERLLMVMQQGGVQRAGDDLNRAMIRTMSEYRKHHEWRLTNRTINAQESLEQ